MSRPLRVALLKPDFGVAGGLESVVGRIESALLADGHDVARLNVPMAPPTPTVAGLPIPPHVWETEPEYFTYLAGRDAFDLIDTRRYDVVISTQAPSFSHRHPRHLSVFYHHHRVYYDLEDAYLAAGFAVDEEVHRRAGELIRGLDQPRLDAVGWFLAGSRHVAERLVRFNGIRTSSVFCAGVVVGDGSGASHVGSPGRGAVLSVGRHEFPKRTELVVAAAHLLPHVPFCLVGTGGRMAWARGLDHRLANTDTDPGTLTDAELWLNTGEGAPAVPGTSSSNVAFAGRLDDVDLARRFRAAPCVIAPAYEEDYGLTAIEAMAQGRPVIVCRDGGGLTELVDDEKTGLVVEPTPVAIATAVERLTTDADLAAELGANGLSRAAELSWDAAEAELVSGLERVMA